MIRYSLFASCLDALIAEGTCAGYNAALDFARGLGFSGVEENASVFGSITPEQYSARLAGSGMRLSSAHYVCRLASSDQAVSLEAEELCLRAAENAAKAGAEKFMIVPATRADVPDMDDRMRAEEAVIAGLNRVVPEIRSLGLTPTLENFSTLLFTFSEPEGMCRIAEAVGGLGLTLDTGNFRCIGRNAADVYDIIRPRVDHCHFKDWRIDGVSGFAASDGVYLHGAVAGTGVIPVCELLFRLRTDGYNGWIVAEESADSTMKNCLEAVSAILMR